MAGLGPGAWHHLIPPRVPGLGLRGLVSPPPATPCAGTGSWEPGTIPCTDMSPGEPGTTSSQCPAFWDRIPEAWRCPNTGVGPWGLALPACIQHPTQTLELSMGLDLWGAPWADYMVPELNLACRPGLEYSCFK